MKKEYFAPKVIPSVVYAEHSLAAGSGIESSLIIDSRSNSLDVEEWELGNGYVDTDYVSDQLL